MCTHDQQPHHHQYQAESSLDKMIADGTSCIPSESMISYDFLFCLQDYPQLTSWQCYLPNLVHIFAIIAILLTKNLLIPIPLSQCILYNLGFFINCNFAKKWISPTHVSLHSPLMKSITFLPGIITSLIEGKALFWCPICSHTLSHYLSSVYSFFHVLYSHHMIHDSMIC